MNAQESISRELAIHKAGHMVVLDALGKLPLGLRRTDNGSLSVIESDNGEGRQVAFVRCAARFGGMCAHLRAGTPPGYDYADDFEAAEREASAYVDDGGASQGAVEHTKSLALSLASEIIDARWSSVEALADLIQARGSDVRFLDIADLLARNAWFTEALAKARLHVTKRKPAT